VVRDLWINKMRTLLVVLSIAVGIFAIGTIAGTQAVITREAQRVYADTRAASATLSTSFDDDFVKAVRRMPGIADAAGRSVVSVRARVGDTFRTLTLVAVPDFNDIRIDKFTPVSGAWPPAKREMLLERSAVEDLHAAVGDTVTVELADGTTRELAVAGTAYDFSSPPPILGGTSYGYITLDTLEWLGFARSYNQLGIVVSQDALNKQHIQDVTEQVRDRVEKNGGSVSNVRIPDPGKSVLDSAVQAMLLILGVLGVLTLLASGFLIVNVIAALMTQQVRQVGVMKSFGAQAYQIAGMYLAMMLALGVLAIGVGLPLGVISAQALSHYGAGLLNIDIVNDGIPVQVLLLQVAVGLAVPVVASLYPVLNGARMTVYEAINSYGVSGHFGEHLLDRLIARIQLLSRPIRLALRNTFRHKGRLVFTLSTLTLGGAIFVGVFCVRDALNRALDDSLRYWNYNVIVYTGRAYNVEQLQRQALGVNGVLQAEAWGSDSAVRVFPDGRESRSFEVVAPPAETKLLSPILLQGRWLRPDDMNAIVLNSDVVAEHPDLHVGSTLQLKINDHKSDWQVVGIVRGVLSGRIGYMSLPAYGRAARRSGRANSVVVVTDQSDAQAETRIAKELEDRFKLAGMPTRSATTTSSERATQEYQFGLLVSFLVIMAILLAIVGGLGLMGTMSINVLERIREIGVMRAIGASDGALVSIITVEGVFIGVLSWGMGVVLALGMAHYLNVAIGSLMLHEQLVDTFSPFGALLWLLIVVVVSALASLVPAWRAARLSVRDVLLYE
jgi:putative ABC transport system permease protein